MGLIEWSDAATNDLYEIWAYIAIDNDAAADKTLDAIKQRCILLSEFPGAAEARPDLGDNVRTSPVGMIVIYYRPKATGIEVLRLIHGSRIPTATDILRPE
ncbi:MAG TPA: type II toxin-antitoxin system RelE/ParE family toxin [Capsulimonadaceae bacterium]|jgi:toxin ParE1/3/4